MLDLSTMVDHANEAVTFPDTNLEAAIREAIGKPTGNIYRAHLERLTYLRAVNLGISNLSGLEYCSNLVTLYLPDNQINDITQLIGLTKLSGLDLVNDQISDILPLAGLVKLNTLHLCSNKISDISPLAGLINLQWLNLDTNQVSDISAVARLTDLYRFDLSKNQVSDISPLAGLINMQLFYFRDNQVSDISPLAGLPNLHTLSLSRNQISDISPLAGLTDLQSLFLSQNQINDISPLTALTSLQTLHLIYNQISDISSLANLTNLYNIRLSQNQISSILPVDGLNNLTTLQIDNNQISDISPLTGLNDLQSLSLSENQIIDISCLAGLTGLQVLYLSYNEISDISHLAGLTNLKTLSLSYNAVHDISALAGLMNLQMIFLWHNQVHDISLLAGLINLNRLDLSSNQISNISPLIANMGLGEGDEIDLRSNPLSADSINIYIPQLEERGVVVSYDDNLSFNLTIQVNPPDSGTTIPDIGSHTYDSGTLVELAATPTPGYNFSHWSGDAAGTNPATTVTMDCNKDVTANFILEGDTLEVETAIGEGKDVDGVAVITVSITNVKDLSTQQTVPGVPIAGYSTSLSFNPDFMEILEIRGGDPPFDTIPPENIVIDNVAGTASVSDDVSPSGTLPSIVVFRIVARLNDSALISGNLMVNVIEASNPDIGTMSARDQPMVLTFQRGDINGNGDVDIIDAMYGAQYIVGIKTAEDIRQLNMASVKHDEAGDVPTIEDCMFIAQYLVGMRNEYFELAP